MYADNGIGIFVIDFRWITWTVSNIMDGAYS